MLLIIISKPLGIISIGTCLKVRYSDTLVNAF
jgi:hypothetical protein